MGDDFGVHGGAASGYSAQRVDELVHPADAVLEEVADAATVVNTLAMATAARLREFALLQLVGATRGQVFAMMRGETRIIVVAAVLIGTLAVAPSVVGTSIALTRMPMPSVPPLVYPGIVAVAALLGSAAIMISARLAMRSRPIVAIGARE